MMTKKSYLSLGSNMGDRAALLKEAEQHLREHPQIKVETVSPVYETQAWPDPNQPMFLNAVVALETSLSAEELLQVCESIEQAMGRKEKGANTPRPIDLDILLYGNEVVDLPRLKIPHPRMKERAFVLRPLRDIAPGLTDPVTGEAYSDIVLP